MTSDTTNRLTTGLTIGLLIALATALGLLTTRPQADLRRRPSTFFTDDTGARALLLVLQRHLPAVGLWRRPLLALPAPSGTNLPGTLLVAGPDHPLSPGEAGRLESWVAAGGQLILLTDDGWRVATVTNRKRPSKAQPASSAQPHTEPRSDQTAAGPREPAPATNTFLDRFGVRFERPAPAKPIYPRDRDRAAIARTVASVSARAPREWQFNASIIGGTKWTSAHPPLATAGGEVIAVEIPHGRGRIVALADPGFVSNQALREGDNAVWLVHLCAAWPGSVVVDEYHHGFGEVRGAAALTWGFVQTPWGGCALQLLGAGALYALLYRRRMGRLADPAELERRRAADLVEARAGLLRAARARQLAADLIVQQLGHALGAHHSQPAELLAWCECQSQRHRQGALGGLFAELERLYRLRGEGKSFSELTLVQLGQAAGRIHRELGHEH